EPRSAETEDRWQRHVMILLGVVIALLIVVGGALLYAKMHGVFEPTPSRGKPAEPWGAPPWPEGS
ncbi:MAG TPA: hypothetical protein VMU04_16045, partial [Candidatus Acidoferrum sp.]|nr:hypothetical protein [Candidatus Acidoferrum sp.]